LLLPSPASNESSQIVKILELDRKNDLDVFGNRTAETAGDRETPKFKVLNPVGGTSGETGRPLLYIMG
jgi:hypothetical protein